MKNKYASKTREPALAAAYRMIGHAPHNDERFNDQLLNLLKTHLGDTLPKTMGAQKNLFARLAINQKAAAEFKSFVSSEIKRDGSSIPNNHRKVLQRWFAPPKPSDESRPLPPQPPGEISNKRSHGDRVSMDDAAALPAGAAAPPPLKRRPPRWRGYFQKYGVKDQTIRERDIAHKIPDNHVAKTHGHLKPGTMSEYVFGAIAHAANTPDTLKTVLKQVADLMLPGIAEKGHKKKRAHVMAGDVLPLLMSEQVYKHGPDMRQKSYGNFKLDLNHEEYAIWRNEKTGQAIMAIEGTDPSTYSSLLRDGYNDMRMIFNGVRNTDRYMRAIEGYKVWRTKHNGHQSKSFTMLFTGHSLGASVALAMATDPRFDKGGDLYIPHRSTTMNGKTLRDWTKDARADWQKRAAVAFDPYIDPRPGKGEQLNSKSGEVIRRAYGVVGEAATAMALRTHKELILLNSKRLKDNRPTLGDLSPLGHAHNLGLLVEDTADAFTRGDVQALTKFASISQGAGYDNGYSKTFSGRQLNAKEASA
jgi:hypothetical protein